MPTDAYEGSRPIANVDRPMSVIVMMNVRLRPVLSPMRPNSSAPRGRTAKPAANVSNAKMNAAVSLTAAKNCREIIGASEPKRMKS